MLETFLYSLAGGMLAVLSTAHLEQIAWKFLRLASIIPFALLVGCLTWTILGSSAVALAPTTATGSAAAAGVLGITAACFSALRSVASEGPPTLVTAVAVSLGQLLGSWVLGSITLAWLLGHAYLTATSMTIAPLKHFSRMLTWSVIARLLFVGVSLALAWVALDSGAGPILKGVERAWLIAVLRFGVGLVAVGIFAYMVLDCVKLRSTQSATGILYFGSVMAYVGELAAQQLTREVGWPL